jgi:uncharacterized membrane protein HdeD (DUF308 family)
MPTEPEIVYKELHLVGFDHVGKNSGWLLAVGAILIVLGLIAVTASAFVTLATMVFIGCLMLFAGILQTSHAIMMRNWSGFYIDLLAGILNAVIGVIIIGHPGATAVALTLMIAVLLIFGGIFRIAVALSISYQNRIWLIIHGVINLMLACAILSDWPLSGMWVVGLFIGIDMIFNGWTLIMLGLIVRKAGSQ